MIEVVRKWTYLINKVQMIHSYMIDKVKSIEGFVFQDTIDDDKIRV